MKILVTAKRVTDPDAKIRVKPDGTGIETAGLEYKLNPFCENAIEAAVSLIEKHTGEVVAVTIGNADAKLCTIGEGTSEIQRLVIGRYALGL